MDIVSISNNENIKVVNINGNQFMKKIIIVVLFIFYPYYIDYIVRWIYGLIKSISSRMPKNVYNDL
jgi:hypothetical protein